MKKGHRRVHHLFWYLALPILIVFLFMSLPNETDKRVVETDLPVRASIAIIP